MSRPPAQMRIGIDLGGTKIEIVVLDGTTVRYRKRVPTPTADYGAILTALADLVHDAEHELGVMATVGVGTPGAFSQSTGLLKNSNSLALNGRPLDRDLSERLGRPVRLQNDANCFALSEAKGGAGRGAEVVFGAILGTGVGGGVVVHGGIVTGRNRIGGEWGHNPLPWPHDDERPGPACYCGKRGCIETFLSGPGLTRDHREAGGDPVSAAEVALRAEQGDARAQTSLGRYCDRLARALATVINVLDPEVIVLGGGVSRIAQLYSEVPKLWSRYVFSDRVDTQLSAAVHGDSSGVLGAAWLWP